jgi:deazaflavin-dependent oxidoreductase (nitroreductase family)
MADDAPAPDPNDFNAKIIAEFRANGGKVGPPFEGAPMVLLTSTGAKSGQPRVNPLVYTTDGDRYVVVASKAGAPTNPDWYHNVKANPEVTLEIGEETFPARATIAEPAERDRLFAAQAELMPGFKDYEKATDRVIPVVVLERIG